MATQQSLTPLKADNWVQLSHRGTEEVKGDDHTSVILRFHAPHVLIRCALHNNWPDQAILTAGQLRTLATKLNEMADRIDHDGHSAADEATAELETIANALPNGIAGAVADGASEEGLSLNANQVADAIQATKEALAKPAKRKKTKP